MITVYLFDGTPVDVWSEQEMPENSTLIPPTDGLYQPRKFDPETGTWSGATKEEWESSLPVNVEYPTDDTKDKEIDDMKKRIDELERLIQQLLQGTD
ncbi:heat shock factor-binding 1 family protein [Mammaliicoccus sciuri]|uniref:heat shock factor-binding 1 family protein n=1 Tax=Mammaliicoccus sciuri TaxID=1296 RepID=UPI001FB281F7|nr:heat shock factor-binding 1 family protein [Mammaliicoccus sciuri]MCJ0969735.1 heat shock factor-binding 1 family protein [Mammaliicoccus sciuri]